MSPDVFYGGTDVGRMRDNNEDAFVAEALSNGRVLACVIDGVGGYEGGEVAAAIARECVLGLKKAAGDVTSAMKTALQEANTRILDHRMKNPELEQMACVVTMAVADLENNSLQYAHVGDTRLYLLRDASLVKLTRDQSFVGFLEDNKRISEEEAMNHPKRNEISKAIGFDPNMRQVADYIETGTSPFLPGDLLLLCSDGLTDLVDNRTMTSILTRKGSLRDKTEALIARANEMGGKDNITVVLVHNNRRPKQQRATRPQLIKKGEAEPDVAPPAPTPRQTDPPAPRQPKRGGGGLTLFLLLLCLLLGAAAFYFYRQAGKEKGDSLAGASRSARRPGEQRLLDSLNRFPVLFLDSSFAAVIPVTDTLALRGDSVRIYGNGQVLRADSSYRGPGLALADHARYLLLENIVLDGFDIGVLAPSGALHLKNVRFRNCRVPVQYALQLPQGPYLNGTLHDSLLFKRDSLPRR